MGMAAKKKAPADDRKPRTMKSFAAFICAQPYDLSATEITRVAQSFGYDVSTPSTVGATRDRYENLRFVLGNPPTPFVMEFLASNVEKKVKNYTAKNSMIGLNNTGPAKTASASVPLKKEITNIVDLAMRESHGALAAAAKLKAAPAPDTEALWGLKLDGTPKKRAGRKPKGYYEGEGRKYIIPPEPEPPAAVIALARIEAEAKSKPAPEAPVAPAPEVTPEPVTATPEPPAPIPDAALAAPPQFKSEEEEDDDVQLQRLREEFDVGDAVEILQPSSNGTPVRRPGGVITDKERAFAVIKNGDTYSKVAYKRLALSARLAGNGLRKRRANSNAEVPKLKALGNPKPPTVKVISEGEADPLMAIPLAFASLRAVLTEPDPAPEPVEPHEPAPTPELVASPIIADEPVAIEPLALVEPAEPIVTEPAATRTLGSSEMQDVRAFWDMGANLESTLRAKHQQRKQRVVAIDQEMNLIPQQIEQLKLRLAELEVEREQENALADENLKQADLLSAQLQAMGQVKGDVK